MTPEILASIVINFCGLKKDDLFNNKEKTACAFFMLNCSVDREGQIKQYRVDDCKGIWKKNKSKLIKEYGG